MNNNKKYLIIGALSTLILMLGFSLAYFAPIIRGEGKKISVRTGSLAIVFTDTQEITEEEILPGWTTSKSFTIENESNNPYYYNINLKDVVNTFVTDGFLQYKITSTNGYNMDDFEPITKETLQVLGEGIEIGGLETQEYTIYFRYVDSPDVDQSGDMNKEFSGYLSINKGEKSQFAKGSLGDKLLSDNKTILTRTDFDSAFTEENTGTLYKATGNETEDVNGDGVGEDVYYFAGNAQNNWVKFGRDKNNADLYWRIIRTNEDGSVRLLYVGPDKATTNAIIGNVEYNSSSKNTMYVGYMYGTEGNLENNRLNNNSSSIKTFVDNWYSETINIKTDAKGNIYNKYISKTAIYCNDRSSENYNSDIYTYMYYAAYDRLSSNKAPSYKCGNNESRNLYSNASIADKFSVSSTKGGNGNLTYPVALITADEISYAGGKENTSSLAWYYYNSENKSIADGYWLSMTPYHFDGSDSDATIFYVSGGYLEKMYVSDDRYSVRPVLSLKSCVKYVSGDGSSSTPYEVSIDSTCASLEN